MVGRFQQMGCIDRLLVEALVIVMVTIVTKTKIAMDILKKEMTIDMVEMEIHTTTMMIVRVEPGTMAINLVQEVEVLEEIEVGHLTITIDTLLGMSYSPP